MASSIKKYLKFFSLIELVIVIAIISVLGTAAFLFLSQWLEKSKDSRKISDINVSKRALIVHNADVFNFPFPGKAIPISNGFGKVIGYQGFLDESVLDQMSTLSKPFTDPTTRQYYSYTLYNNDKGFELATFLSNSKLLSNFIGNRVYALGDTKPYVNVYGDAGFCDESGVVSTPKPLTMFDKNTKKFVNKSLIGEDGQVFLNLDYLIGEGQEHTCAKTISAPVIGIKSDNSDVKIDQAIDKKLVIDENSLKQVLQEVCEKHGLCNMPDIYKLSYNYIVLVYKLPNGSIEIVEVGLDQTTGKYVKKSNNMQIFDGIGTNEYKGVIKSVKQNNFTGAYEIVYVGGNGGLYSYKSNRIGGGYGGNGPIQYSGGGGGGGIRFAQDRGGNTHSGVVGVYSQGGASVGKTHLVYYPAGSSQLQTVELPFECRMPRIINISQNVYLIMYIMGDGSLRASNVSLYDNGSLMNVYDMPIEGDYNDLTDLDLLQVWDNIYLLKVTTNNSSNSIISLQIDGFSVQKIDEILVESDTISNFNLQSVGGGYVNVIYNKFNQGNIKLLYVNDNGKMNFIDSQTVDNCNNISLFSLDQGTDVYSCNSSNDLLKSSQTTLKNIDSIAMCGGTLPENSTINGNQLLGKSWFYNETFSPCAFTCLTGYQYNSGFNTCDLKVDIQVAVTDSSNLELCEKVKYTINITALGYKTGDYIYTFDGGNSWINENWSLFTGLSHTLESGLIKVKNLNGKIYSYDSVVSGTSSSCIISESCKKIPSNALYFNGTSSYSLSNADFTTPRDATIAGHNSSPTKNTCQWKCKAGYYYNGTNGCSPAGLGQYVPLAGATAPTLCTNKPVTATNAHYLSSTALTTNSCPIGCETNYSWNGSSCISNGWYYCAKEHNTCRFYGTKQVKYGHGSRFVTKTFTNQVACSNRVFGDPAYGIVKSCYVYYGQ